MDTFSDTGQENNSSALRLNKKLIELNDYLMREGISTVEVEHLAKIGLIQLRKHRDKTFVVDTPATSYDHNEQIDREVAELMGITNLPTIDVTEDELPGQSPAESLAAKLNESTQQIKQPKNPLPSLSDDQDDSLPPGSDIKPGHIADMVSMMLQRAEQLQNEQSKPAIKDIPPANDQKQPPPQQKCKLTDEVLNCIDRQLDEIERGLRA